MNSDSYCRSFRLIYVIPRGVKEFHPRRAFRSCRRNKQIRVSSINKRNENATGISLIIRLFFPIGKIPRPADDNKICYEILAGLNGNSTLNDRSSQSTVAN